MVKRSDSSVDEFYAADRVTDRIHHSGITRVRRPANIPAHCLHSLGNPSIKRPARPCWLRAVPETQHRAQNQAQVETGYMDQQAFQNVAVSPEVSPTHTPGVVSMREAAFHELAALPHQPVASWTSNATAIAVHGITLSGFVFPVAATSVRL